MDTNENFQLEIEEPFVVRVGEPVSTRKNKVWLWFRRLFNIDDVPNQKHHRPIFIIVMCILHILIFLSTYITINWMGKNFAFGLFDLLKFYVPCMRPTSASIRTSIVSCNPSMKNTTCLYDDQLRKICFSFLYPHQLWRLVTVNLLHFDGYHLLANLLKQLLYGILLEQKYGSFHMILIYWFSELGASLSSMIINREKGGIGASGAMYGLMLFFTVDRLRAIQINTGHRILILMQLVLFVLVPVMSTTLPTIIFELSVAHSAHVGGGLVGFLFGISMLGCPLLRNSEHGICGTICQGIGCVLLSLYFVITITISFLMDAPIVYSIFYKSKLFFNYSTKGFN